MHDLYGAVQRPGGQRFGARECAPVQACDPSCEAPLSTRNRGEDCAMTDEVLVVDGARSAIGTFGGALAAVPP
ncbi:MAG: hypothetical protein AAF281_11700, partial [Pseudomonadota bacterium]